MTELDKLIELKNLEKQNRRTRLADKKRQEEFYCEIEELFDPSAKIFNTNSEAWQAHVETMQAIQTQTLEALVDATKQSVGYKRQSSYLGEQASLWSFTTDPRVTWKDDRGKKFAVDNDKIDILLLMCN